MNDSISWVWVPGMAGVAYMIDGEAFGGVHIPCVRSG